MPPFYSQHTGAKVDSTITKAGLLLDFSLLTGGTSQALDSFATVDVEAGLRALIPLDGALLAYVLEEADDEEASPDVIRPDDFDESNPKIWRLLKGSPSFSTGSVNLTASTEYVDVELTLNSAPVVVVPSIVVPADGILLVPVVVGTPTAEGFRVYFQGGPVPDSGYVLKYLILL